MDIDRGCIRVAQSRGKQFEKVVREAFERVSNTSVIRLHDQTTGFAGSANICDLLVYNYPNLYCIECKSVHGNTLPFSNITDKQWQGMLEQSQIEGVFAGVICWWVDKDVTLFLPIDELELEKQHGWKSIRYDIERGNGVFEIKGKKKRVFFDYDMEHFFEQLRRGE